MRDPGVPGGDVARTVAGAFAFKGGDPSYSARGGSGGGGGAGALRQRVFRISEVYGQTIAVTVGAGGAGGTRGSSVGLYDNVVEYSNASGGMTKTPTISGGASKSNSVSSTSGLVVSNGSVGNAGSYGGGSGGATDGGAEYDTTVYNGNNGSAGGASSFGSYVIANGAVAPRW